MLRNEGDRLKKVVVCTPGEAYFNVSNLEAHNITALADPQATHRQHARLKSLMAETGSEVVDAPELADHPNSVFTRDVSLCTPRGYVKLRMGLETRRGEEDWMAGFLEALGEPCAGVIEAPGTVEGGDVILAGSVAFVGQSARTNAEGVRQLSVLLEEMDYELRTWRLSDAYLHIGGAMSAIGSKRVVCCRGVFPKSFFDGFDVIEVERRGPSTANVICLGDNQVIVNQAENREAMETLAGQGVTVHGIDLSEFRKGTGGPTCLILPVTRG